jgi:predicted ATPase/class 3 adenylate cyclase
LTGTLELEAVARPAGTVTFLLTDIVGSTRNWETSPVEMRASLARHDELLNSLIAEHHGQVLTERGEGDSFFAVFARASDAVVAASAIQLAVAREDWPAGAPVRVRIAIHTGEAEGDYRGQDVNRCARLRALAHGGQVLLSATTAALAAQNLPAGASLTDLQFHRLRDLTAPEHIYQLNPADLPASFPPLRSIDARRHNLPPQSTSFVGRAEEIEQLRHRLGATRVLTITGPGGSGKTRLALQLAAEVLEGYQDGAFFVDLAEVSALSEIEHALALSLEIGERSGETLRSTLIAHLADQQVLIVLDNCEHVVAAVAEVVQVLVRSVAGLRVLATSREALGLPGETIWVIPALSLPPASQATPLADLQRYEAIRLFVDRAVAVRPEFDLDLETGAAIVSICRRLDGLPLAIELAAARTRVLEPAEILRRLDDRFALLTGGGRVALPRQQTLRAAVDWSHDLLSDRERLVFRRLSVFAGGFDLLAAEAVCADDNLPSADVLDLLSALIDKSLVAVDTQGVRRYRLHETLRQYGLEKLVEADEGGSTRGRHLAFFTDMAEGAYSSSGRTEPTTAWLERQELENDNYRAALGWAREHDPTTFVQLCGALSIGWWLRALHLREGREWLTAALTVDGSDSARFARALTGASLLASWQLDPAAALPLATRGIGQWEAAGGSASDLSVAHEALGWANVMAGDDLAALAAMERSLELARGGAGERIENRATLGVCQCLVNLDRVDEVTALATEALQRARALDEPRDIHLALHFLADAGLASGKVDEAANLYQQSLHAALGYGNTLQAGMEVQGASMAFAGQGRLEDAIQLNAAAQEWLHAGGMPSEHVPFWARYMHRYLDPARQQLGPELVEKLEASGRAMGFDSAIDFVLARRGDEAA